MMYHRGLVRIQWNLGRWMTLRKLQGWSLVQIQWKLKRWMQNESHLMLTKISPPSKKVKRSHLKQKPSKIGHLGSLRDLGVNQNPFEMLTPVIPQICKAPTIETLTYILTYNGVCVFVCLCVTMCLQGCEWMSGFGEGLENGLWSCYNDAK